LYEVNKDNSFSAYLEGDRLEAKGIRSNILKLFLLQNNFTEHSLKYCESGDFVHRVVVAFENFMVKFSYFFNEN